MENSYTEYKIQNTKYRFRAQSLLEALLSIALGVLLIGGSVGLMGISLKTFNTAKQHLQANSLMRQTAEIIQSLTRDNWHNIYDLTEDKNYYATSSENTWSIFPDQATSTIDNIPYERYFRVYDVNRNESGNISDTGNNDDPSTRKITIFLEYGNNYVSSLSFYLTRSYNNQVAVQNDWSGGSEIEGPYPSFSNTFATSTNINTSTPYPITMTATTSDATLTSSILDTGVSGGAGFNSLLWLGDLGTDGKVKFQIAFSNCSNGASNYPTCNPEGWTYYGCTYPDPASCIDSNNWTTPATNSLWSLDPNTSLPFLYSDTPSTPSPQNNRYIRYKVYLSTASTSPQINDIIINWTP